jgi:hypothetical protein
MGWNAFLDVAIGLALMYFLLSIFCTVLNEVISTFTSLRAKNLASGITQLLDDPTVRAGFYDHGLICGAKDVSGAGSKSKTKESSYMSGRAFAMALLASLDPTKPVPGFADVEDAVGKLPDSNMRDALLAQIATADKSLTALRDGVATWFDESMDRLSGVYKRKLKLLSIAVGLALAVVINADTISVATRLWYDGTLRAQIVAAAATTIASGAPASGDAPAQPGVGAALQQASQAAASLRPFPFGWTKAERDALLGWGFLKKALGLALTTLALVLGAPFWFDLLSKFMQIRGTGRKPDPTDKS